MFPMSGNMADNLAAPKSNHKTRESAVLSMPTLFHPTQLFHTSPISKFATYEVEDKESADTLLMKSLKNERCVALQLKFEMDKLDTLEHPYLPKIIYNRVLDNYSYVVYEKCNGNPLWTNDKTIKYPEHAVRQIAYQLACCMQYTHAFDIVHRDLRPDNILVQFSDPERYLKPKVKLVDFGASKTLKPDQKLAIYEDGSAYMSGHVRQKNGQFPAPEVLMDLRYDRQVDSWFFGVFLYMLISGSHPFPGGDNDEIKAAILYHQVEFSDDAWLQISASLDEIVNGLLLKDPKKRWTIDHILWSRWIQKTPLDTIYKQILTHWLRRSGIDLKYGPTLLITEYLSPAQYAVISYDDRTNCNLSGAINHKSKTKLSNDKYGYKFANGKELHSHHLVSAHNKNSTIIHQSKMWNFSDQSGTDINRLTFVTAASNIWVGRESKPITFEYVMDYIKDDIFVGVVSDEFDSVNTNESLRVRHIGSDRESVGISLRKCVAYFDGNELKSLSRYDNKNRNPNHNYDYTTHYSHNAAGNVMKLMGADSEASEGGKSSDMDVFEIEFTSKANTAKNGPDLTEYYDLKRSTTKAIPAGADSHNVRKWGGRKRLDVQRPYRKMRVRLRIDCVSRTLSVKVNEEVLEPLYIEFPGSVTAAVTLCNCLDQCTLESVQIDAL